LQKYNRYFSSLKRVGNFVLKIILRLRRKAVTAVEDDAIGYETYSLQSKSDPLKRKWGDTKE
jgi:hypothetical protein